jgi:hypothetical protein
MRGGFRVIRFMSIRRLARVATLIAASAAAVLGARALLGSKDVKKPEPDSSPDKS